MSDAPQSRFRSAAEALTNVVVGYGLAVATQILVFPLFGVVVSMTENFAIGAVFTGLSLVRSYVLRRLFTWVDVRRSPP